MTRWIRKNVLKTRILYVLALVALGGLIAHEAFGVGIGQIMRAKSLPEATVAVIDPETGSSSGGSGSDIKLATGDVILFRFAFTPVPEGTHRSMGSYLTEYIPPGTEIVGARIIDEDGNTIQPLAPGLGMHGCPGGTACTDFDDADCAGGTCAFHAGTMAGLHGDTGIFYVPRSPTDTRLLRIGGSNGEVPPSDTFITMENGILMDPDPVYISTEILPLLLYGGDPHAHNAWDWAQVQAFGTSVATSGNKGKGNTPFRYGSAVAGPQSYYLYEATDEDSGAGYTVEMNNVVGPWLRAKTPGGLVGAGGCVSNSTVGSGCDTTATKSWGPAANDEFSRLSVLAETATHCGSQADESCAGADITPLNAKDAAAVRFSLGEGRTGRREFVEVALRVTSTDSPLYIDPDFGAEGGNVDCGESFGSNIAMNGSGGGENNSWASYVASPACVYLRLLFDLTSDNMIALGADEIKYTLHGKNLSVEPETNVVVRLAYDSRVQYVRTDLEPVTATGPAACPAPFGGFTCRTWTLGTLQPSDEYTMELVFEPGGGGQNTAPVFAWYVSDSLPAAQGGFQTREIALIKQLAQPVLELAQRHLPDDVPWDPTIHMVADDGSELVHIQGSFSNVDGTAVFSNDELNFRLPNGWSIEGGQITIGGIAGPVDCTLGADDWWMCPDAAVALAAGGTADLYPIAFDVRVPDITGTEDLFTIDTQFIGSQPGFGGTFETFTPDIVTINVGAFRTAPPVITCPVAAGSTSISGTAEDGATVVVAFNLLPRDTAVATGGAWTVTAPWDAFTSAAAPEPFDVYGVMSDFGELYGGIEVRATAKVTGKLVSELSARCDTSVVRECQDGEDNDSDGLIDYPADPGCDSPGDTSESDGDPECSDKINNNDNDTLIDWDGKGTAPDPDCWDAYDVSEMPDCDDGVDNDGDGDIDYPADTDCTSATDQSEAFLRQCQDREDNGGEAGVSDFDTKPTGYGDTDEYCHSPFDNEETTTNFAENEVKARLLILFDTSGSMNYNTCNDIFTGGDGSVDHPGSDVDCADVAECSGLPAYDSLCGNGIADDSRLFQVKQGLTNVLNSFGEVEFGLMRFKQRGHTYQAPTSNGGSPSGGWVGAGYYCGDQTDEDSFNHGQVLVSFSPDNPPTLLTWMDEAHNYPGDEPPPSLDWELRGSGATPLAGSLTDALTYLSDVEADDWVVVDNCRPYRVILVTDGAETCAPEGERETAPVLAAEALYNAGYPVDVIAFSVPDGSDAKIQLDAIADAGAGGTGATAIAVSDQVSLSAAFAQIISETILVEECNYADDNCDGRNDEEWPVIENPAGTAEAVTQCDNGQIGACLAYGYYVCTGWSRPDPASPAVTRDSTDESYSYYCDAPYVAPGDEADDPCNGIDDDCDGLIDEGFVCPPCVDEICNGLDDDCDSDIDELPIEGVGDDCGIDFGICELGTIQCVDPDSDPATVNSGLECVGGVGPEVGDPCDGVDNDCDCPNDDSDGDGVICDNGDLNVDEDPGVMCYPATEIGCVWNGTTLQFDCQGICSPGISQCVETTPGSADYGPCTGATIPQTEVCDGIDNDCDGQIDEDWQPDINGNTFGDTCSNNLLGECEAFGIWVCNSGNPGGPLICTAPNVSPGVEWCNGLDDDCDGDIDDNLGAPVGETCGGGGDCNAGHFECVDPDDDPLTPNSEIQCVGSQGGTPEVCDGLDNDCDELIDEDLADVDHDCYPADIPEWDPDGCSGTANANWPEWEDITDATTQCVGECEPGVSVCVPGLQEIQCVGYKGPAEETCNGRDDDCDGLVDNGATCPDPNDICIEGVCVFLCEMTEFPCPFGYFCQTFDDEICEGLPTPPPAGQCRLCLPDPCVDITCDPGSLCDPEDGQCHDLCEGVNCQDGETCRNGFCFDCFDPTCATQSWDYCCDEGENCVPGTGGVGECVADPCYGVECDDNEYCSDGECLCVTCDPACDADQYCDQATCSCVDNATCDPPCAGGQVCNPVTGQCQGDRCTGVFCPTGETCNPDDGECITDPCVSTDCPAGFTCEVTWGGRAICIPPESDPGEDIYAAGGGGCGSVSATPNSDHILIVLAGLGLLFWPRRRRRRRRKQRG